MQSQEPQTRRSTRMTRQQVLYAVAAMLMSIGVLLLVLSFALLLRNRDAREPVGIAVSTSVARSIEKAGLGCADFKTQVPRGGGIVGEGQCEAEVGRLRIIVYRTPETAINKQKLTRDYQCLLRAAAGQTQIVSITDGVWVIKPPSADLAAAQAIADALGGEVTTVECAPPAAAPIAPTPEPAPEAPPA